MRDHSVWRRVRAFMILIFVGRMVLMMRRKVVGVEVLQASRTSHDVLGVPGRLWLMIKAARDSDRASM